MTADALAKWKRLRARTTRNFATLYGLPGNPGTHPADRPTEPVSLYRGATHATRFGVYWTTLPAVAAVYAHDRERKGREASVYAATIDPEWIFHRLDAGDPERPLHPYVSHNGEHMVHPAAFLTVPVLEVSRGELLSIAGPALLEYRSRTGQSVPA